MLGAIIFKHEINRALGHDYNYLACYKLKRPIILSDILIKELQVTSYELISLQAAFIARVTSYDLFLLHELRVTFCIRVTSYCLLHELRVTFIARVTSYCLLHELRVTVYCTSHELYFNYELQ